VRQKTVSAGAEEIKNMVAASAPPQGPVPSSIPVTASASPKAPAPPVSASPAEDDSFDPLGAFLQDLDSSGDKPVQSPEVNVKQEEAAPVDLFDGGSNDDSDSAEDDDLDDDLDDFDLDIFDDPSFDDPTDDEPEVKASAKAEEMLAEEAEPLLDIAEDDSVFEEQPKEPEPAPVASRQEPPRREAPRPPETRKPQNRDPQPPVAQEARVPQTPAQARSGQGQIRPRIGGMPHRADPRPPATTTEQLREAPKSTAPRVAESRGTAESREKSVRTVPAAQPTQPKPQPVAPSGRSRIEVNPPRQQARPMAERPVQVAETEGIRPGKMKAGRLFGWLVSYEHPDGRAIELRAGRFFVTGTSIRSTDLILEDQSISTPHALMSITENGLQIQDLMSERGTFVRCQGEAQYIREEGVIEIRHGDWIRFGDVEFLVTVVPA
jgi:hypothetical protein